MIEPKVVVIADDLTGAGDAACSALEAGFKSEIIVDVDSVKQLRTSGNLIIINTESRNIAPKEAYGKTKKAALLAKKISPSFIYKKCDSALRGNIGAELDALIDVFGLVDIPFVPAYPKIGRYTKNLTHYINGIPVSETYFSKDPKSPVLTSSLEELICRQSAHPSKILPMDAPNQRSLKKLAFNFNGFAAAGSSGFFGEYLKRFAGTGAVKNKLSGNLYAKNLFKHRGDILIVNGSNNPVSREQIENFAGVKFASLKKGLKIIETATRGKIVIINAAWLGLDSPTAIMAEILSLAQYSNQMYNFKYLVIFGGETSYSLCKKLRISRLASKYSFGEGIGLFAARPGLDLVLKPGGFGAKGFLPDILGKKFAT